MSAEKPEVDVAAVRGMVDRAVTAAVPPAEMVERKIRPESTFGYPEPRPRAGLQAALLVVRLATDRAHRFCRDLRGEGAASWEDIADLLEIPWSSEYVRRERAYELVAGAAVATFTSARVYWTCGGAGGCGQYVTDHGPYDGNPRDTERGHAEGCTRNAADVRRYEWERDEQDRRGRIMDEAWDKIVAEYGADSFAVETVKRARYVQEHGGKYLAWSTGEAVGVALALDDKEQLAVHGYTTKKAALAQVTSGMGKQPKSPTAWLALVRAAATGHR